MKMLNRLTSLQYDLCIEFRNHLWEVLHQNKPMEARYYADKLDSLGISWRMQNRISEFVFDSRNDHVPLYSLLEIDVIS